MSPRQFPDTFGQGVGRPNPEPADEILIDFRETVYDVSFPDEQHGPAGTFLSTGFRFDGGLIHDWSSNLSWQEYAGSTEDILHIGQFYTNDGVRRALSLGSTKLFQTIYGGASSIFGTALPAAATNNYYTTVIQDKYIIANAAYKLQAYDAATLADLSADSPQAPYVIKLGNRLVAADADTVYWCADGLITDWTTANLGAGNAVLEPEGLGDISSPIRGLGLVAGAGVVYRKNGLVLMQPTGIGAAPFRFTTVAGAIGTDAPYSICNGGSKPGNYFLGTDDMPYYFDGSGPPVAIGVPVQNYIQNLSVDRKVTLGKVDVYNQEVWFLFGATATTLSQALVFNIREWEKTGKLVWRITSPSTTVSGIGFLELTDTQKAGGYDAGPSVIMFGGKKTNTNSRILAYGYTVGNDQNWQSFPTWRSGWLGNGIDEIQTDRLRLWGTSRIGVNSYSKTGQMLITATNEVGTSTSITVPEDSFTGGVPKVYRDTLRLTGKKIAITITGSGNLYMMNLTKLGLTYAKRGRGL